MRPSLIAALLLFVLLFVTAASAQCPAGQCSASPQTLVLTDSNQNLVNRLPELGPPRTEITPGTHTVQVSGQPGLKLNGFTLKSEFWWESSSAVLYDQKEQFVPLDPETGKGSWTGTIPLRGCDGPLVPCDQRYFDLTLSDSFWDKSTNTLSVTLDKALLAWGARVTLTTPGGCFSCSTCACGGGTIYIAPHQWSTRSPSALGQESTLTIPSSLQFTPSSLTLQVDGFWDDGSDARHEQRQQAISLDPATLQGAWAGTLSIEGDDGGTPRYLDITLENSYWVASTKTLHFTLVMSPRSNMAFKASIISSSVIITSTSACCSDGCAFDSAGTACGEAMQCDGGGICQTTCACQGGECCSDGCTFDAPGTACGPNRVCTADNACERGITCTENDKVEGVLKKALFLFLQRRAESQTDLQELKDLLAFYLSENIPAADCDTKGLQSGQRIKDILDKFVELTKDVVLPTCTSRGASGETKTPYGECVQDNQPLYCHSGKLLKKCDLCGCPDNFACQEDGTCKKPQATEGNAFLNAINF